jgi:D-alanyl-D-alanine carboxypeptidase (penicillin-binding protein 5/6)
VNCCKKRLYACLFWLITGAMMMAPYRVSGQVQVPDASILAPKEIAINAKSAVLMDQKTGQVLVEFNQKRRIPPASFAKLMTLYITFDTIKRGKLHLDDEVFISKKAWQTGGSKMFIEVNSKVPVRELIKGIAVVSGNDACVALAEHLSGSTDMFVNIMNETAAKLGMTGTHFMNPHGLPNKQQYTTAYDMALLARNYVRNFPEVLKFHSMQEYTYSGIRQYNRNRLLRKDASVDGLKTGYISAAGYHLLATAKRRDWRLIAVVMGAQTPTVRENEVRKLLNYGYQNFELLPLFTKGQVLAKIPVWKGARDMVSLVAQTNSVMAIPIDYKESIRTERKVPSEVIAPVQRGQEIGKAIVKFNADVLKSVPLVAQYKVNRAGFFKALSHSLYRAGRHNTKTLFILIAVIFLSVPGYFFLMSHKQKRRRTGLRF